MTPRTFDAVVLAGGASRRLGEDKALVEVAGRRLLDRVLDAVAGAERTVVVGPERPTQRPVLWVREDPPGGGPAAALQEGLRAVRSPVVVVVGTDLPFLDAPTVEALRDAVDGHDGAVLVDDGEREQLVAGAWDTSRLRDAVDAVGDSHGAALRTVLAPLRRRRVRSATDRPVWLDCDTPEDLARAREHR